MQSLYNNRFNPQATEQCSILGYFNHTCKLHVMVFSHFINHFDYLSDGVGALHGSPFNNFQPPSDNNKN